MAEDIKKDILINVEAKTETLIRNAAQLNATLDEMKAKLKSVQEESGKNSIAYQEQASKVRLAQTAIRENNKELDMASRALKAASNSIEQNRALVATLTAEHIKLSQAEGASSIKAQEMEARLKSVNDTLKAQEKAYGDNRRNVGNYEEALGKLNTSHQTTNGGLQKLTSALKGTVGGFGFMPQAVTDAGASLSGFVDIQKGLIGGFAQHNAVIAENKKAQEALTIANEQNTVAAQANEIAQQKLAVGEITETEAAIAATTAKEASTAATEAQTVATAASTAATEAGTTGLKLLRIALASTGIGLLIVALGSLVAYFESSNEGSKKFKVILAEINAVVQAGLKVFSSFGKTIFDAVSHPIDSLKALEKAIVDNVLNRFKAISVILDGIIHLDFKKVSDGVIQSFTGVTNATDKISKMGKGISDFAKNTAAAADAAGKVTVERQKLTKAEREWSEEKTKQQGILDKLKLQIRDQGISEKDRLAIAEKAKAVSDNIFKNNLEHAQKNAELVQREQALNSKKDYQAITDAKNRVQELKNAHDAEVQSIQNRESRVQKMVDRKEKAGETEAEKSRAALAEADKMIFDSNARQLQNIYDTYGDEIIAQDQHYNDELAKLQKLHTDKIFTISKFNEVKRKLEEEHHANIQKVVEKFAKEDAANVLKMQNELANLYNQGIANETEKQIAILKQQEAEKLQQIDNEGVALKEQLANQLKEIADLRKDGNDDAANGVQASYDSNVERLKLYGEKRVLIEKQTLEAIKKAQTEHDNQLIASIDQANVIKTDKPGKEAEHLAALKQQLDDEYNAKIAHEASVGNDTMAIRAEYNQKYAQLDDEYNKNKFEKAKGYEQMIQQFTFSYLTSTMQRNAQLQQMKLDKEKDAELKNSSLTTTQKQAIEEKYRVKQGQEKVKEFKTNQKLSIAQALINGFVAMLKTTSNVGFPLAFAFSPIVAAQTAATIAGIAAQKPPAYAIGGLHYNSDGKGSMLRGPGTGTSDSMNARLSNGESIINAKSTSMFWPLLSHINQMGGGRAFSAAIGNAFTSSMSPAFATGGIYQTSTYLPTADNGLRLSQPLQINQSGGEINYDRLIGGFADAVSQLPPGVVDVKDVSYQQQVMSKVMDRVNC
jgi:hypothetical protein